MSSYNSTELEIIATVENECCDADPELRDYINELIEPLFTAPTPQDAYNLIQKIGLPLPEPEDSVFMADFNRKNRRRKIQYTVKTSDLRQIYPVALVFVALGYSDAEAIEHCLKIYNIHLNPYKSTKKCNQSKKGGEPDYFASALTQFQRNCKKQLALAKQLGGNPFSEVDLDLIWGGLD